MAARHLPFRCAKVAFLPIVCALMPVTAARAQVPPLLHDCAIEGEAARCGSLSVPEDHAQPDGRRIALPAIVLGKTGTGPAREPIFVLAGGPGQAATSLAQSMGVLLREARRTRDVVLIDQRGTGGESRLQCAPATRSFVVPLDPEGCLARLSQKATLRLYGTESFVQDLEVARKALGYGRIVLYGMSYGTRAAYVYARRFPQSVAAVALLAPAPITMPLLDSFAEDGRHSLDSIVDDCLADRGCGHAFPRLRDEAGQVRRTISDPFHVLGLQLLQYSTATAVQLPSIISAAASGNLAPLDAAAGKFRDEIVGQLALGLHLTIICGEDLTIGAANRPSVARQEYSRACRDWPGAAVSPGHYDRVKVSLPALVVVGEWDPVTSPRWAREAAALFSQSQLVTLPKAGHIPAGYERCLGTLVAGFLERGAVETSCGASVRRPPYVLK